MQINRGRIHMPLRRRRRKSARSRDARPRVGINPAPQLIIRGPSALDARDEPPIKSGDVHDETDAALISGRRLTKRAFRVRSSGPHVEGLLSGAGSVTIAGETDGRSL